VYVAKNGRQEACFTLVADRQSQIALGTGAGLYCDGRYRLRIARLAEYWPALAAPDDRFTVTGTHDRDAQNRAPFYQSFIRYHFECGHHSVPMLLTRPVGDLAPYSKRSSEHSINLRVSLVVREYSHVRIVVLET